MLTHIVFKDGSRHTLKDAAEMIGMQIKDTANLRGICDDTDQLCYIVWRATSKTLWFVTASGSTLASVPIKWRNNSIQFEAT